MKKFALNLVALALVGMVGHATAGDKGTTVELDGLKSATPASWKAAAKTSNKFRIYQFALPKADGDKEDAELVIFYFGPGGGGGTDANVKRWQGTFAPPVGKNLDDVTKIDKFKVGDVAVTYVEISGTYLSKFPPFAPNAKVVPKENYRFIGAIFESKDGPYFFKLQGPARTVTRDKTAFDNWIKAFK